MLLVKNRNDDGTPRWADGEHPMWHCSFHGSYMLQRRPLGWHVQGKDKVWHWVANSDQPHSEAVAKLKIWAQRKHTK